MSIFAKSFKLALCIVSFLLFLILLYSIHISIVISLGEGWMPASTKNPDFWWKNSGWYAYLVSYCVIVLISIPLYSLIASSIYTWSLSPFRIFWTHLRNR
ncbi:similar to maturase (partial length) [Desulfotalea psychrophila LSv54]|uniref:Similar to maturase (Partial length) n=1 Tax=Desulfotalea psychrophila (strain LSv54 / DSM 12343) TaxID=177439 RepID=Q6AIE9_DESPS|nr:similar to maturase (partial length) [Desulfotalea psychrophila LSv54]